MKAHGGLAEMVGKTPKEFQEILFPGCEEKYCDMEKLVKKLMEVADRGGGFYTYKWRLDPKESVNLKIAYVKEFTYSGKSYIIGAGYYLHPEKTL